MTLNWVGGEHELEDCDGMDNKLLAAQALGSGAHLACVAGPDRGAVLPLRDGQGVERDEGLTDPHTSRTHSRIERVDGRWYLNEAEAMNRPLFSRSYRRLRSRRSFYVGSNKFVLRNRPVTPTWEVPSTSGTSGSSRMMLAMRFMLPLFLLFTLLRFVSSLWVLLILVPVAAIGLIIWAVLRRKRQAQFDCASLALATASMVRAGAGEEQASNTSPGPNEVSVLLAPSSVPKAKTTVEIPTHGSCATVGPSAFEYALWIAGQVRAQGKLVRVARLEMREEASNPDYAGATVFWSHSSEPGDVPIATVLPARATGAGLWRIEMQALLEQSRNTEIPSLCHLDDLLDTSQGATFSRWASRDAGAAWSVPVGVDAHGPVVVDLVEDGPHALVVGGTGSGKSEFLSTLVLAFALRNSPENLRFVFIDYKGGAGLEHLTSLPHVEHSLTDLDGAQTPWLLRALRALLNSRKTESRLHGFRSLDDWAAQYALDPDLPSPPPRVVIVADEVRTLADQHPSLLEELVSVCRQGRSLGVHLIAATQRPGGAISSEMRSVIDLRVALRCAEVTDSMDAIGSAAAAHLPRVPGRAIVDGRQVQLAHCEDPGEVVASIRASHGAPSALVPEVPAPLPTSVTREELNHAPAGTLGFFEDPATCVTARLVWDGSPLMIAGPPPSAKTLADAALNAAAGAAAQGRLVWAGPPPHHQPLEGFLALGDHPSAGDLAYLLTRIPKHVDADRPATLVIPELSETLNLIGLAAGPEAPAQIMRDLLDAGHRGLLTLIVTDTKLRFDARQFDNLLVHVPSMRVTQYPEIARLLPHREESPMGSLDHWISADPGRFVAIGFGKDPSPALLPLGKVDRGANTEAPLQAETPVNQGRRIPSSICPGTLEDQILQTGVLMDSPANLPALFGDFYASAGDGTGSAQHFHPVSVQVIADPHINLSILEDDLRKCCGAGEQAGVERLPLAQWHRIDPDPRVLKVVIQPSREVVRALATHVPDAAIWLNASLPFPEETGVVVTRGTATRLKLGPRYTDVTVRT